MGEETIPHTVLKRSAQMIEEYKKIITDYACSNYKLMFREPNGLLKHPYIVPGASYTQSLWDWDSWLTNVAIRQMFVNNGEQKDFVRYERGCVINFLENTRESGCMPHLLTPTRNTIDEAPEFSTNMHKPVLAQHVAFILKSIPDETQWFEPYIEKLDKFLKAYMTHQCHENGLYFWLDDAGIGVDNDPCTFYRPPKSSGAIFLNCLMYKELQAMEYICDIFKKDDLKDFYRTRAEILLKAVRNLCWDEKDGFYYSVDLNLYPIDLNVPLHSGCPRHWDCLIQRIGSWSGFLAMWSGIATQQQAQRMVKENLLDDKSFNSQFGVRTLSKYEKMYVIKKSGNPSCWLGPVWGISNYLVFKGLVKYGFVEEARNLAYKTIKLFGQDIEKQGCMSEYYHPDTGEGINNPGFQNWNLLVLNMIAWLEDKQVVSEF